MKATTAIGEFLGFGIASVAMFFVGMWVGTISWMPLSFPVYPFVSLLDIKEYTFAASCLVSCLLGIAGIALSFTKRRYPVGVILAAFFSGVIGGALWMLMSTAPHYQLRQ